MKKQVAKMKPLRSPKREKPLQMIWNNGKQQGSQLMKNEKTIMRK